MILSKSKLANNPFEAREVANFGTSTNPPTGGTDAAQRRIEAKSEAKGEALFDHFGLIWLKPWDVFRRLSIFLDDFWSPRVKQLQCFCSVVL